MRVSRLQISKFTKNLPKNSVKKAYYVIRESCNLNVVEVMINEIKKIVNDLKTCEKEDIIKENE